jgi:acetylornithine/N-succinyldiaminopimelate aminotransferase
LRALRHLCDEQRLLLIVDEVQTGMARTGRWFAYQHADIEPDILLLAKALGGGFPISAMVMHRKLGDVLGPGTHAATFGGNPLACACGLAVCETIEQEALLGRAQTLGAFVITSLKQMRTRHPVIREVRGKGLMIGIELTVPGQPIVDACRARGILINCTQGNVLRLLPALTVTRAQLERGLRVLDEVFGTS